MKAQDVVARAMPTIRILWFALTVSTLLLAVVAFVVHPQVRHAPDTTMVALFGVLGVVLAVTSFVLPATTFAANAKRSPPEVVRAEPTAVAFQPPAPRFAQPEKAARQALAIAQTAFILSMALSEAVSLLGLVLHMQGAPPEQSAPFFVAGTLLAALRFPTPARLLAPYERVHGAAFAASTDAGAS
jgi:hypothetical protein